VRFMDAHLSKAIRVFVCLNLLVTTATSILGQSIEPSQCVRPTVTQPAALAMTPMNPSLPSGTLNVLQMGAVGDGTANDTGVIQSIVDSNPNSTIYFPMALYLLHNENQPGLQFSNFHGTAIMQSGARFLCDTIATPTAGSCIKIVNSSNVTLGNFDIGYIGDSALPFPVSGAGNTAMLVEGSQNVTLNNTTIEHSPGPGIWVDTSTNVQFLGGTSVNNTSADGLHFDNVGSAVVNGYFSQNTGDDALGWDNDSTADVNCGLNASNIQIYRSLSSGIAVHGGCGATFSNFYIDTTANSGLMVGQNPNSDTLVPRSNTFTNGKVLSSGRYNSPIVSGKDCIDVTTSQGATFNNVACVYPLIDGASINGSATDVTLNGVTVDAAPNVGFAVGSATNVWLTNTISRNSVGGGYVFIGANRGSVSGSFACNSGGYGYYHAETSNLAESDLTSYDSSEGNSSNRAWWAENGSSNMSLNGMLLVDDKTSNPIVVGDASGNGTITINDISLDSPLTTFLVQELTATPAPTVTLSASPTSIAAGSNSTLTWSSTNATSCTASGGWTGTEASAGTLSVSPANTTTYSLTCTGTGGTSAPVSVTVSVIAATNAVGPGASLVFSYPDGFVGASGGIQTTSDASQFSGSVIALNNGSVGQHEAGSAWYKTQQNIQSFTTDFTFQLAAAGLASSIQGITFAVQNSNRTTDPINFGIDADADANGLGYAAYTGLASNQFPIYNSIAVKFDLSGFGQQNYPSGGSANATGLYINGGPSIYNSSGLIPENDLNPSGINLHSGDVMAAHIVYDGSLLTMTLRDTVTNAQFRYSWPIDIPAAIGSNTAWVGFTAGEIPAVTQNLLTWDLYDGYNARLASPTFSLAAGSYPSAQTVSLSAPAGSTIYYTTNGKQPTTASTQYTDPITVSSSEIVQAIAVETGYTDSLVGAANYQIASAGTPTVNFPGGFASPSNLITLAGASQPSGSAIQLTDTINQMESSAAWYDAPVNVQSFTTNFTIQLQPKPNSQQVANGMTFTIQNQNPTSTDSGSLYVSGGPNAVGNNQSGLGYAGLRNSVAVAFDIDDSSSSETGDLTGLYTNGANPTGSSVNMASSGLNLMSGNPLAVSLNYNGTTLDMTITDTVTRASFSNSWDINIPSIVGGNTAYIGFTASTGYQIADQKVLSWTYSAEQ
jgi:hypothetical protein